MNQIKSHYVRWFFLLLSCLGLISCGGEGSSNNAGNSALSGVNLPTAVSMLQPQPSPTGSQTLLSGVSVAHKALAAGKIKPLANVPTTSDFVTDESFTWVDITGQAELDSINALLCLIDQMGADLVLNQSSSGESYTAKINLNVCDRNASNGASPNVVTATVSVLPKTDTSLATVKFWIEYPPSQDFPANRVYAQIVVTTEPGSGNPFGEWAISYETETLTLGGSWVSDKVTGNALTGMVQAKLVNGQPQILMLDISDYWGSFIVELASTIHYSSGGTDAGQAHIYQKFTDTTVAQSQLVQASLAFDTNLAAVGLDKDGDDLLTSGVDINSCQDRHEFTEDIWFYNLYHAVDATVNGRVVTAGQRVGVFSNFVFTTTKTDGTVTGGFASPWGAFLDDGSQLQDGQALQRVEQRSGTTQPLTAHVTPERLQKFTHTTLTLADLLGQELYYYSASTGYRVHIDSTTGHLMATADLDNTDFSLPSTGQQTPVTFPLDLTDGTNTLPLDISLYPAFSGDSSYTLSIPANTAPTLQTSTLSQQLIGDLVSPNDTALSGQGLTVYCWLYCPVGGDAQATHLTSTASSVTYNITADANGVLSITDTSNNLAVVAGSATNLIYMTSLTTSPNYASSPEYTFSSDPSYPVVSFSTDTGELLVFDAPIDLSYTHSTTNDRNADSTFNAKTFTLSYDGFSLQGLPWGSPIAIKDGVTMTDGINNYLVRGMDISQVPAQRLQSDCTNAGLDTAGVMTSLPLPQASDMKALPFGWNDKPTIPGASRVMEGALQF